MVIHKLLQVDSGVEADPGLQLIDRGGFLLAGFGKFRVRKFRAHFIVSCAGFFQIHGLVEKMFAQTVLRLGRAQRAGINLADVLDLGKALLRITASQHQPGLQHPGLGDLFRTEFVFEQFLQGFAALLVIAQQKLVQSHIVASVQLHCLGDAAVFGYLLKLLQRGLVVLLDEVVLPVNEESFAVFAGLGIVCDDPSQPILGLQVILVGNVEFRQGEQGAGMQFFVLGIQNEFLQHLHRFFLAVDVAQHPGQVDVRLAEEGAVRPALDQGFELVLGLESAVAFVVKGSGHQEERVVAAAVPGFVAENDAAFLDGLGVLLHGLVVGPAIGVQGPGLRGGEILARVVQRVHLDAGGQSKGQ